MNSKIYVMIGFLCVVLAFTVALPLKPQTNATAADDPNEFVVSFKSDCLQRKIEDGEVPMYLFQDFTCIQSNEIPISTPTIVNPNDPFDSYDEVAIFFKIGNDSSCLENADIEFECFVFSAYSPKLVWNDLKSSCLSTDTAGLPGNQSGDAINLDLLNNKQPYLTKNDNTFRYYPIDDSNDPGVDIYLFEQGLNVHHKEFEGIKDQIVVNGTGNGDPHGAMVLSVMIGANYGVLRGWPGTSAKSKAYVYLGQTFGDYLAAFKTWTESPNQQYLQSTRKGVINLSNGIWLDSSNSNDTACVRRLTNAIDNAIQLDAIVVVAAGQDEDWLPTGVDVCEDQPRKWFEGYWVPRYWVPGFWVAGEWFEGFWVPRYWVPGVWVPGKWRIYPSSLPSVITVGALMFDKTTKNIQPTTWTHYGGSCVDLWAMGQDIIVPRGGSNTMYTSDGGTSFASPLIASLVAVELSRDSMLYGEKAAMVTRLKQCGRGFWVKPSTPASERKCPQPDTCWAPSYICDDVTCNKLDVALLVDVSKKMSTKECKRQQLEVAETLAGFRGIDKITESDKLTYPQVRVSYIEFDDNPKIVTAMTYKPINAHAAFNPVTMLQRLCNDIRDSPTCNNATLTNRTDNPDLDKTLSSALGQFDTSDDLQRDKKILIFSGINDAKEVKEICTKYEKKIRTGSSKESSEIERKDNENGINIVMVNNRPDSTSMPRPSSYLMCLVEYDDERIMWNEVGKEHFPFIEKIHEEICEDPTAVPTTDPTIDPTFDPTFDPTRDPTRDPTLDPTIDPTTDPTMKPTSHPTLYPTLPPTDPTIEPTFHPTLYPTSHPTLYPTLYPTFHPTTDPTIEPTSHPTTDPTIEPTTEPTTDPTIEPTFHPTFHPTSHPTLYPTLDPTGDPTGPTLDTTTTISPTSDPTTNPSRYPTIYPTRDPTTIPTSDPTTNPSRDPTTNPTITTISTPVTSESQCKICEIQNGDCVHCGDEPWCTYDSLCLPDVDSGTCVSISGQSECYCNDYETIETCPMGLKCTEQTHVGCWACDPCADDGVMKGHVGFESICYLDCDLNCVYETVNGDIKECVESQAHSTTTTSTLTCHDIGFDLRKGKKALPHDCQCQSECGGRYCNPFVWITQKLNYEFDIDDDELLCDDPGSMCCCSCPNCPGFLPLS